MKRLFAKVGKKGIDHCELRAYRLITFLFGDKRIVKGTENSGVFFFRCVYIL